VTLTFDFWHKTILCSIPPNNSASPRRQGDVMGTAYRWRFSTSYRFPFVNSQRRRLDGALDVVFNVESTSYKRRDPTSRVTSWLRRFTSIYDVILRRLYVVCFDYPISQGHSWYPVWRLWWDHLFFTCVSYAEARLSYRLAVRLSVCLSYAGIV